VAIVAPIPNPISTSSYARASESRIVCSNTTGSLRFGLLPLTRFDEATVLTLDRGSDLRCGSPGRPAARAMTLELPDTVFPRLLRDDLVRPRHRTARSSTPTKTKHKVQWLSVAGDGRLSRSGS